MRPTLHERLNAHLQLDEATGCLLWTGQLNRNGYGRIAVGGKKIPVHRVAWELEVGPIPPGLVLDHVKARGCRHRNCANVAHLEPVTNRENILRGDGLAAVQATRTRCPRNHPYDEVNTYVGPDGKRYCRACHRARMAAVRSARK